MPGRTASTTAGMDCCGSLGETVWEMRWATQILWWLPTLRGEEMKEMSQEESKSEEICDGMIERRCWRKDWAGGQDNEKSRSVFHLRPLLLFTINGRKWHLTTSFLLALPIACSSDRGHNIDTGSCFCLSLIDGQKPIFLLLFYIFIFLQGIIHKNSLMLGELNQLSHQLNYLLAGDRGQQKHVCFSHQRPSPSHHHTLHQAASCHQTVAHSLHEGGAVRLSVGG